MGKHSEKPSDINWFQRCWDLGYHNLLPVVPPTGGISNAGKRPGLLVAGKWVGKASKEFVATEETCRLWHEMGASVGLSCNGTGLCGVDIDTLTPRWVDHVLGLAHEMLGPAVRRIGRAPKVLLPYNCPVEMRYAQVRFNDSDGRPVLHRPDRRLAPGLVETLAGDAKWFVACGVHPQTRQRYAWPDGLPPRSELTTISMAQRDLFMEQLRIELPEALRLMSGGGGAIAPEKLRGDPGLVAEAMRAMPNDPAVVGYDQWRNVAIALRGALESYSDGLELFQEWTDRAGYPESGEGAATEKAHRVFASVESARELGADYIYHQAEKAGWTGFASRWFIEPEALGAADVEAPYESIFGEGAGSLVIEPTLDEAVDPRTIPPRDFLYGTHIVRRFASMTIAPSKVGKSSLLTVDVLAMVTGRTLLPRMKPKGCLRVWYINGEDPREEIERRFAAGRLKYGLTKAEQEDRLYIDSGRSVTVIIAIEEKGVVRIVQPLADAVLDALKRKRIDVLVLDPFVSTHRVRENGNIEIEAVMAEWVRIADMAGVGIEFVHHARKAGVGEDPDSSVDAARGATAMVAKMRSARALGRMTKAEAKTLGLTKIYRSLFRVTDASSNLAPWVDDETEWLRLENVDLGNGPDGATAWSEGDHIAVVTPFSVSVDPAGAIDVIAVLQALGGEAFREDVQAGPAWVGHSIATALNLDLNEPDDKATVRRLIGGWVKTGVLERVRQYDKNRNMRWYVKAKSVLD